MTYWYFRFEGRFNDRSPEYGCKGVFSSCMVPASVHRRAKSAFLQSLKEEGIELIEILEHFAVDAEELDAADQANRFWIEWYEKTKKAGKPVFDKYQVFDE